MRTRRRSERGEVLLEQLFAERGRTDGGVARVGRVPLLDLYVAMRRSENGSDQQHFRARASKTKSQTRETQLERTSVHLSPLLICTSCCSIPTNSLSALSASARFRSPNSRNHFLNSFSRSPSVLPNSRNRASFACCRLKSLKWVRVEVTVVDKSWR